MKKKAFLCVDIGSSALKCAVASYAGKVYAFCRLPLERPAPTIIERGMSCALQLEEEILKAESDCGIQVQRFYVVVPPLYLSSAQKEFFLNLSSGYSPVTVTDLHRSRLHHLASLGNFPWDYRLISVYPLRYYIDASASFQFPLREKTRRIGLKAEMVFVMKHFYRSFEQLGTSWGIEFGGMVPFFMGMEQYLKNRNYLCGERVLMIGIGKQYTAVASYDRGCLSGFQQVFCGGQVVDRFIAESFGLPLAVAEEMKISYGSLFLNEELRLKHIHLKTDEGYRTINSFEFIAVLRKGYRMLVDSLLQQIGRPAGFSTVVFFGSVVSLEGFEPFLKEHFPEFIHVPVLLVGDGYAPVLGGVECLCEEKHGEARRHAPLFRFRELMKEYFSS